MGKIKKRRKLKWSFLTIVLLILVFSVCGFGGYLVWSHTDVLQKTFGVSKTSSKSQQAVKKLSLKKESVDYEAKIFMVGDSLIHTGVYDDAYQNGVYDFKPMLQFVKPIVSQYDLAYYNQETVLGGTAIGLSSYPRFNSPQEVGDAFLDAGFNMVSLATNHTMDRGEDGVLRSVQYWNQHPEVASSGQWSSYEEREKDIATVYEVNHIKYAFISYTIWNNGLSTPQGKDYLNNEYSEEKAAHDIAAVRDQVDFVIVAMHWGTEYYWGVDAKQEEIAHYLSGLGVDLIIGAHPHVVETVEYINDGKTFVIYSLGNFLSDQLDVDNYTGLGMEVTLRKHVKEDGTFENKVVDPKAELFYTVNRVGGGRANFRIKTYPSLTEGELHNYMGLYEHYKAIVNERYPNLTWGLTWE